ncbi:PREDICTED: probable inactive serine/threonine-protein kinase fnkC [Nelumbo nucifera]|uniref:MATH domain-containing protein n=2 Tax=Nelumbo nucifera TaxID=4432 RepID=A0A822Y5E6_NELNU|nr:PREDICTED: probable inactive serine/threonine-protein kinase fnkC [Nelumbo nucifera]DAD27462.1 TPA_asm: hypothetical protein HUJ06_028930 [Nelumbo nucifera]
MKDEEGILRSFRKEIPAHYTLKIKSFSSLAKSMEKYVSGDFEAGGYKWKLVLYPNGNKNRNGNDHISLYLAISEANSLPPGWKVNVLLRLFIFDQLQDRYLTLQDGNGMANRFHSMMTEWGFARFICLDVFNDPANGYLIDDTCYFGAEIYVSRESNAGKGECFSMMGPLAFNHVWRIEKFPELVEEICNSEVFTMGGHKWKMTFYPKGSKEGKGNYLSLYLVLADLSTLLPGRKVYVEFTMRVKDQIHGKHMECKGNQWFGEGSMSWGWAKFIQLSNLMDGSKGFLVDDLCAIEAQLDSLGVANKLFEK